MSDPDVTVIIGAYNAMPYLTRCVTSVLEQSIGIDRLELIAVDDGSTDGTGEELDRFAAQFPSMKVIHQQNSGGPAGPRNVGIGLATGRYIFFLDADDYLGREALERMVAMADRNGSDVVVGKRVGVGRGSPQSMFRENQDSVDLFSSSLWQILSAQKLFRRALIDRLGLRFPDLKIGQDQPFTAQAYLHAEVISVLADYDCYYLVRRDDGGNNTTRQRDIRVWLRFVEVMAKLVADHVPAGDKRDKLMRRHFVDELRRLCFTGRFLEAEPAVQQEAVERAKVLLDAYYTPRMAVTMPVDGRLRFHLIMRGDTERLAELIRFHVTGEFPPDIVDKGRVYAAYPFFRDPAAEIPDECYDVTERSVRVERVGWAPGRGAALAVTGAGSTGVVSVSFTGAGGMVYRHRAPVADGSFTVCVPLRSAADGRPLAHGRWRVGAELEVDGVVVRSISLTPSGSRRRLWWRGAMPAAASLRHGYPFTLVLAPLLSRAALRALSAALRRRLRRG